MSDEIDEFLKRQLIALGLDERSADEAVRRTLLVSKCKTYGHAHIEDVCLIVYQAIDVQNAKSITLKVSKEGDDNYDGHLDIQIIYVKDQLT